MLQITPTATASMGPRSFERGNVDDPRYPVQRDEQLQWGRAHSSAEITGKYARTDANAALQWGRAHSSAEMLCMGSRTCWRLIRLQWGRAHSSAEITSRSSEPAWVARLQWGRAHSSAEIAARDAGRKLTNVSFNGAALIRAR